MVIDKNLHVQNVWICITGGDGTKYFIGLHYTDLMNTARLCPCATLMLAGNLPRTMWLAYALHVLKISCMFTPLTYSPWALPYETKYTQCKPIYIASKQSRNFSTLGADMSDTNLDISMPQHPQALHGGIIQFYTRRLSLSTDMHVTYILSSQTTTHEGRKTVDITDPRGE